MKTIDKKSYEQQLEDNVEKLKELVSDTGIADAINHLSKLVEEKTIKMEKMVEAVNTRLDRIEDIFVDIDIERLGQIVAESNFNDEEKEEFYKRISDIEMVINGMTKARRVINEIEDDVLDKCGFGICNSKEPYYPDYKDYRLQ
jgi:hypothetical protein